jgi:hypothetical protein
LEETPDGSAVGSPRLDRTSRPIVTAAEQLEVRRLDSTHDELDRNHGNYPASLVGPLAFVAAVPMQHYGTGLPPHHGRYHGCDVTPGARWNTAKKSFVLG